MDHETRSTIQDLLEAHETMVLATIRPDGFPQATVMNYVYDDLSVYFYCDSKTQKVRNLAQNPKVSAAFGDPGQDWTKVKGLSLGGFARHTTSRRELDLGMTLSLAKYPQQVRLIAPDFEHPLLFRIDVVAFSILDYTQGFGHHRLVTVREDVDA